MKLALKIGQKVQVKKKITHQNIQEFQDLRNIVSLRMSLDHKNLINLDRIKIKGTRRTILYYEYVPVAFDKWISSIGETVPQELEDQMVSLAQYINSQNISFDFEPSCMGLD